MTINDKTTPELLDTYFKITDEIKACEERAKKGKKVKEYILKLLGARELSDECTRVNYKGGTIFRQESSAVNTSDMPAYREWVFKTQNWETVQLKPYKTETLKFVEKTGTVPDGVDVRRWYETRIHAPRSTNKYIED